MSEGIELYPGGETYWKPEADLTSLDGIAASLGAAFRPIIASYVELKLKHEREFISDRIADMEVDHAGQFSRRDPIAVRDRAAQIALKGSG